ncbi:MAG TPA: ferrous iron transport protein B [Clostridiaceae bacterium]|nr:ferrous iron transport protein B [Clostridiaceae bacterium]
MGIKKQSMAPVNSENQLILIKSNPDDKIIALAGNPNVGKSTVFNGLTGLNQHTGNWPGKTVTNAQGRYLHKGKGFILVDLPGIYSLMANSVEEEVARDFICFGNPDTTVIVADATCLERNLNLVLQTLEITNTAVLCVNLLDEAKSKKIKIDLKELSKQLGIPVVGTCARNGKGLYELMDEVYNLTSKKSLKANYIIKYDKPIEEAIAILEPSVRELIGDFNSRWIALKLLDGDKVLINSINQFLKIDILEETEIVEKLQLAREVLINSGIDNNLFRDKVVSRIIIKAEEISRKAVSYENEKYNLRDRKIDRVLTSKAFGIPIMLALLGFVFWLTIIGANYPSQILSDGLFWLEGIINEFLTSISFPVVLRNLLVEGVYRTLAWVISVMLPPMAIFFPLFSLLEDLGYLPRIAFNLDNFFKKACAHGKQALTMCMGFGCNAAGVVGCRIIDSPRERLIAIITNSFVPCNGRFPTIITTITIFFAGYFSRAFQSLVSALILTGLIVLSVVMTLLLSKILSKTILKGLPSSFTLELPPYRKPQISKVIARSIFDRTLFVLGRAVIVAAPAGLIIWIMANITIGNISVLSHCANFLNPLAQLIGLDGYILMAFILGFPANEIVMPIIIMSYMSKGSLLELENLYQLSELLTNNGWTWLTAVCFIIFTLMHWPCGTTCLTIKKETQSRKWTIVSFLVPTITGAVFCFIITTIVRVLGII